jgi:hypothetical protein
MELLRMRNALRKYLEERGEMVWIQEIY